MIISPSIIRVPVADCQSVDMYFALSDTYTFDTQYAGGDIELISGPSGPYDPIYILRELTTSHQEMHPDGRYHYVNTVCRVTALGPYMFRYRNVAGTTFTGSLTFTDVQPTSLSISPSAVRYLDPNPARRNFTMTVGNGAGMVVDFKMRFNSGAEGRFYGYALDSQPNGSGTLLVSTTLCTPPGNYQYTAVRNNATQAIDQDINWVTVDASVTVELPFGTYNPPVFSQITPAGAVQSSSFPVRIDGNNFQCATLSSDYVGLGISAVQISEDARVITANFNLAGAQPGVARITISAFGGPITFDFVITAGNCSVAPINAKQGQSVPVTITCPAGLDLSHADLAISNHGISIINQSNSPSQISGTFVIKPDAAVGPLNIGVIAGFAITDASLFAFTVLAGAPPTISSMNVSRGARGTSVDVIIYGENLLNAAVSAQDIGLAQTATTDVSISVTFSIPAKIPLGPKTVTVSNDLGSAQTTFLVTIPPPGNLSLSPVSGVVGAEGVPFTITGTNLMDITESGTAPPILRETTGLVTFSIDAPQSSSTRLVGLLDISTSTQPGPKTIELIHSGGSATTSFTVNPPEVCSNCPRISSVSPQVITKGSMSVSMTLSGSGFLGPLSPTHVEIVPPEVPGQTGGCVPTPQAPYYGPIPRGAEILSDSAITLLVDIPDSSGVLFGFYAVNLLICNPSCSVVASTSINSQDFRVIPASPMVDAFTPGAPRVAMNYVLEISGHNLANSAITPSHPGIVVIVQVNTNRDIQGVLAVDGGVPPGPYTLSIQNSSGACSVAITVYGGAGVIADYIIPPSAFVGYIAGSPTSDHNVPQLALQPLTFPPNGTDDPTTLAPAYRCAVTRNLINFRIVFPLIFCADHGSLTDGCLTNLMLGQRLRIGALILSLFIRIDLTIFYPGTIICLPVGWPSGFLLRGVIGFEAPGVAGSFGVTTGIGMRTHSMTLILTPETRLRFGVLYGFLEVVSCDPPLIHSIEVQATGQSFSGTPFVFNFSFPFLLAANVTVAPWCTGAHVTVIAWLDPALITLPTGPLSILGQRRRVSDSQIIDYTIRDMFERIVVPSSGTFSNSCCEVLYRLVRGQRSEVIRSDEDRKFANAFLLKNSPNTPPPPDFVTGGNMLNFGRNLNNYRLFHMLRPNSFPIRGGRFVRSPTFDNRIYKIGNTSNPCGSCITPRLRVLFDDRSIGGQSNVRDGGFCPADPLFIGGRSSL